jgi:hypothetical protein
VIDPRDLDVGSNGGYQSHQRALHSRSTYWTRSAICAAA